MPIKNLRAHSRQHTPSSRWSVSGTHKAQEIKAVNKGPSDKGSPDSYESLESPTLAVGSFRTRADGRGKKTTNGSDEHEGRGLHLALPAPSRLRPSLTPRFTASRALPSYLLTTAEKPSCQNLGRLSSFARCNCVAPLCQLELEFYRYSDCNGKTTRLLFFFDLAVLLSEV